MSENTPLPFCSCEPWRISGLLDLLECAACSTVRGLKWGRMTLQNKINVFVFVFVHKKHLSYLLRKLNSSLKFTMLAECSFIGTTVKLSQLSEQTADWWNYWGGLWWRRKHEGSSGTGGKTHVENFFTLVIGFKTGCILVTVEMKMYIYVYMPSVLFFCCWDQSQCAVCYGFSWQCCNGKKNYKNV